MIITERIILKNFILKTFSMHSKGCFSVHCQNKPPGCDIFKGAFFVRCTVAELILKPQTDRVNRSSLGQRFQNLSCVQYQWLSRCVINS